ncbi:MAG TPA: PIN domain-containing protein [Thermoanaerobaculia bacterium]|nr:PIN domain-containing protein [Thermoanaerobaculia bacterium]
MIVYLDSSVVLRIVLGEPNSLREWGRITLGITSTLTRVEAARTLDRNALLGASLETTNTKRAEINDVFSRIDFLKLDDDVLVEASQAFPVVVAALDAIHLASALLYRAAQPPAERPLLFATHDAQLARAARAMNFEVLGA